MNLFLHSYIADRGPNPSGAARLPSMLCASPLLQYLDSLKLCVCKIFRCVIDSYLLVTSMKSLLRFSRASRNHSVIAAVLMLAIVCGFSESRAQGNGIQSDGRDFFIGYMPGIIHSSYFSGVTESYWVLLGSEADNNVVTINYFDDNGVETSGSTVQLQKGRCAQVALDRQHMRPTRPGELSEFKAAHIKAKFPISVQCYSQGSATGGLLQAIPTPALGKKYVIASWFDNPIQSNPGFINRDSSSSEFMVIAPYEGTTINYTPASTTYAGVVGVNSGKGATGIPHTASVTLRRGQVFWVRSFSVDPSYDISGSIVTSDKPIAVLGGHERALLGDPSGLWHSLDNDVRDLMIEQMTPVEDWEVEYPSAPFVAPPSVARLLVNGTGEMYRIYTDQSSGGVDMWVGGNISPYNLQLSAYQNPIAAFNNVIDPVDIVSTNGKKIYVVMYDYFQGQHDSDPGSKAGKGKGVNPQDETTYTCPNEMNVVPPSRWRKNAVWKIPAQSNYKNAQFVNVITYTDSINTLMVSFNGAAPTKLTSRSTVGQFKIPNHPEWTALRYRLSAGDYALNANTPFVVYSYGRTEGQYKDGWGYAAPCGQAYGAHDENNPPKMRSTPGCASWDVTVTDSLPNDDGLADVVLLEDPAGVYARPGRVSVNMRLNPTEPVFVAGDPKVQFRVEVINPLADAYAAIYAIDRAGNDTVFEFSYSAPKISVTPSRADMLKTLVSADSCQRIVFRNIGSKNSQPITIGGTAFEVNRGAFTVSAATPALPATLKGGDSLVVNVCYSPIDTGSVRFDSLLFIADCIADTVPVSGSGVTPIIVAQDADFGTLLVGQTKCKDVTVTNTGDAPLLLTKQWLLHNTTDFTFNDDAKLPLTLQPGQSVQLNFCYTAHHVGGDSTNQDWGTNLPSLFAHHDRDFSILLGRGVQPGVQWDRIKQAFPAVCDAPDTIRMWLYNNNTAIEYVDSVVIQGQDKDEFTLLRNQAGYTPLGNFSVDFKQPGDSVWVDVLFTPNLTKGYAPRTAKLIAFNKSNTNPYVDLSATIVHADIAVDQTSINFGLAPLNTPVTKTFTVTDPGDAPLTITQVSVSDPAFVVSGINVGDVLVPNAPVVVSVTGTLTQSGTINASITLNGATNCVNKRIVNMAMSADLVNVQATGQDFPTTYTCQQNEGVTVATNTGTRNVILRRVDILGAGTHPDAGEFSFGDGSQSIIDGRTMMPGDTAQYHVIYHPSLVQFSSAIIEYTWDTVASAGSSWTTDRFLNGTGDALSDTLTALTTNAQPYTVQTGKFFDVPIRISHMLPTNAAAFGYTFKVSYRQDLLQLSPLSNVDLAPGYSFVGVSPITDNNGLETITIRAMGGRPLDNTDVLATLHFQLMVAKDLQSSIDISGGQFLGQDSLPLCYIATMHIPGFFNPQDLCGDSTIRHYIRTGVVDGQITQISPNPTSQAAQIGYEIRSPNALVTIEVFNLLGQHVQTIMKNEPHDIGGYRATFDPVDLPSGTYTIRLSTPNTSSSRTIVVNK